MPSPSQLPLTPQETDYTLVQIDNDAAAASPLPLAPSQQRPLRWHHVSFSVTDDDPQAKDKRHDQQVLNDVSGEALPGELLLVTGSPRAGKTALLQCLAGRNAAATGAVAPAPHGSVCFIPHDTTFFLTLTFQEHLLSQAELRLSGSGFSTQERKTRVAEVLNALSLSTVADARIGAPHLAAERKLLALATELLTLPSVLLLDEPTLGLDLASAERVVRQLHALARQGRAVVAALSLPASGLFPLFDRLHVLADGSTMFRGATADSVAYFAAHGLACPTYMNPIEFFTTQLTAASTNVRRLANAWTEPVAIAQALSQTVDRADESSDRAAATATATTRFATQFCVLARRNALKVVHNTAILRKRFVTTTVLAVLLGLAFLRLDLVQTDVTPFASVMFITLAIQFIPSLVGEFRSMPHELAIVLREQRNGLYHPLSWYLAKNASELPLQLLFPAWFLLLSYFLVGYGHDAEVFFTFYLFLFLAASAGTATGYCVSCVATTPRAAMKLGIYLIVLTMVFGGTFINRNNVPSFFLWLQQISPVKYAYHGLMRVFWTKVGAIACAPDVVCRTPTGASVLALNAIHRDKFRADVLLLLAINGAYRVLGALALWRRAAAMKASK